MPKTRCKPLVDNEHRSLHKTNLNVFVQKFFACFRWFYILDQIPYLRFPMYSLYNWIGEHEITKLKKYLPQIQKKGHKNKRRKTGMKWNDIKWTIWYFQQCTCVNTIYFAPVVTTTHRMKNNRSSTMGLSLEMSVLARARAQLLSMLYINTHMSVPHGKNV